MNGCYCLEITQITQRNICSTYREHKLDKRLVRFSSGPKIPPFAS